MMIVDKNDPDYKAFEKVYSQQMDCIKGVIVRALADCDDPDGMLDTDLRESVAKLAAAGALPSDAMVYLAESGWLGRMAFSLLVVQLIEAGVIITTPIQGVGYFYKIGPLQKLAAQG